MVECRIHLVQYQYLISASLRLRLNNSNPIIISLSYCLFYHQDTYSETVVNSLWPKQGRSAHSCTWCLHSEQLRGGVGLVSFKTCFECTNHKELEYIGPSSKPESKHAGNDWFEYCPTFQWTFSDIKIFYI